MVDNFRSIMRARVGVLQIKVLGRKLAAELSLNAQCSNRYSSGIRSTPGSPVSRVKIEEGIDAVETILWRQNTQGNSV